MQGAGHHAAAGPGRVRMVPGAETVETAHPFFSGFGVVRGAGPAVQPEQRQRVHLSIHGAGALEDDLLLRGKVVFPTMGGIDFSATSVPGSRPAALARRASGDFLSGASAVPAWPPFCRVLVPAADGRGDYADGSGIPLPDRGSRFSAPVASMEPDSV